jgi:hypothetical protein
MGRGDQVGLGCAQAGVPDGHGGQVGPSGSIIQPLEPQPPPCESQPPPRWSSCLARTVPLQLTPPEHEEGEHSDGDPIYQNPEMPSESSDDTYVEHVEFEDVGNGI